MKNNDDIKNELREHSPFLLDKMKEREGGFQTPDGFFDSLADNIMDAVGKEDKEALVRPLYSKENNVVRKGNPFRWVAVAASLFLISGMGFWMMNQSNVVENEFAELEHFNQEQVLDYLDQHMGDFDLDDLANTGLISYEDIDYKNTEQISEDEADIYIEAILDELSDEI